MARTKAVGLEKKNREKIIVAAKELFCQKGVDGTKIDEIAKKAGMTKSTLYVYFESKEQIRQHIFLEGMRYLRDTIKLETEKQDMDFHDQFFAICDVLVQMKSKYPYVFQVIVEEIQIEEKDSENTTVLEEIIATGEEVNHIIYNCFFQVMNNSDKWEMSALLRRVFALWGSIYGLIVLADNKEQYIEHDMKCSKEQFLQQGFESLYQCLVKELCN